MMVVVAVVVLPMVVLLVLVATISTHTATPSIHLWVAAAELCQ
jgi:hypothetical protein